MAYYLATLSGTARVYSSAGYGAEVRCNGVTFCSIPAALGDQGFGGQREVSFDPSGFAVTLTKGDVTILNYSWDVTYFPTTYDVNCQTNGNGTLTANPDPAESGATVRLTATPSNGYQLDYITVDNNRISGTTFTMPARAVTAKAYFKQIKYNVTCQNDGHGTISASPNPAAPGATVTLSNSPSNGYVFDHYEVDGSRISGSTFTMPSRAVTAKGFFRLNTFSVTCQNDGHGTLSASPTPTTPGTQVTLTVVPASGYKLDKFTSSPTVSVSEGKFTMPASNVTIKAWFKRDYRLVLKGDKINAVDRSQTGTETTAGDVIEDTHFSSGEKAEAVTFNSRVLGN